MKHLAVIASFAIVASACSGDRVIPDRNLSDPISSYDDGTLRLTAYVDLVDSSIGLLVGMTAEQADPLLEAANFKNPKIIENDTSGSCEGRKLELLLTKDGVAFAEAEEFMHVYFDYKSTDAGCVTSLARTLTGKHQ